MIRALTTSVLLVLTLVGGARAAGDEPDLIFRKSTVFKLLTPNDKLATYAIDDPEVEGVACHYTVPERGGIAGALGVAGANVAGEVAGEVATVSMAPMCRRPCVPKIT